jgi:hypothetical protein
MDVRRFCRDNRAGTHALSKRAIVPTTCADPAGIFDKPLRVCYNSFLVFCYQRARMWQWGRNYIITIFILATFISVDSLRLILFYFLA